jgi:hypothetical protein
MSLSAVSRAKDMVLIPQPVFHACLVTRDGRMVNHRIEVTLLLTATSAIQHTRKTEKWTETFFVPACRVDEDGICPV